MGHSWGTAQAKAQFINKQAFGTSAFQWEDIHKRQLLAKYQHDLILKKVHKS